MIGKSDLLGIQLITLGWNLWHTWTIKAEQILKIKTTTNCRSHKKKWHCTLSKGHLKGTIWASNQLDVLRCKNIPLGLLLKSVSPPFHTKSRNRCETRMHSRRMRTARLLTISNSIPSILGGCCPTPVGRCWGSAHPPDAEPSWRQTPWVMWPVMHAGKPAPLLWADKCL